MNKKLVPASLTLCSIAAFASFTTSETGLGQFQVHPGLTASTFDSDLLTSLSALSTALASANTFSYSASTHPSLWIFDSDGDGSVSEQEFVDTLAAASAITASVDTTSDGVYAQAYATELAAMTGTIEISDIDSAITTGNTYAVDEPDIVTTSLSFTGTDSTHSGGLGITDGLGTAMSGGNASVTVSVSATHATDTDADNRFAVDANGNLTLATGVDVQDLSPGVYTVSISATDSNTLTYGLTDNSDVSLTVSNEKGCIINNGIASSNFSAGSGNISGATVTISGNHDTDDKLFVRTSTTVTTDTGTGDVTYSGFGVSGITAEYDKSSGELVFSGTTSLANWISIFQKVGYIYDTTDELDEDTRSLIFSLSDAVPYNHPSGTDHFYEFISYAAPYSGSKTFETARTAAAAKTLFGLQGYLVTITSQAEQDYIQPKIGGQGWIGACDHLGNSTTQGHCGVTSTEASSLNSATSDSGTWVNSNGDHVVGEGEGYWYWVTGPERLDYIGHDRGNSSNHWKQKTYDRGTDVFDKDASVYTNFRSAEPNNYLSGSSSSPTGGEDMLHFYSSGNILGKWNDYPNNASNIEGYLVEYGGMDGDPTVDLTEDKSYDIETEGTYCAY